MKFQKADVQRLMILERKVLRRISGPIQDPQTEEWKILKNIELDNLNNKLNIVTITKKRGFSWAGQMTRM